MKKWDKLADEQLIQKTTASLKERGYDVFEVEKGADALAKIKELIPKGASVMNGSSVTLETIGFVDYLKSSRHGWDNLHEKIFTEKDRAKQSLRRKQASISDYYLGSVHALTETGEFIIASNSGSQLPSVVFNSSNLIFVVGTQKIVSDLDEALKRLREYVIPLEDKHMRDLYGVGTTPSKILIFNRESKSSTRKINVIFVKEKLGF